MQTSAYSVVQHSQGLYANSSQQLGAVLELAGQSAAHAKCNAHHLYAHASVALAQGNLRCYFNHNGLPVGYVMWAWLENCSIMRIRQQQEVVLHHSEWNEGGQLWIIDFAAPHGHCRQVLKAWHAEMSSSVGRQAIYYQRWRGSVKKQGRVWLANSSQNVPMK